VALALAVLAALLLYKLGGLVGGLSAQEASTATAAVGWHGIYHDPFNLPLKVIRSVVYALSPSHGQTLTRLPNTIFGALAVAALFWLIRTWHGWRTAVVTTILFMTAAWTLHVSRLASTDVLYLWSMPMLLLANLALHKRPNNPIFFYGSVLLWGCLLYIPGMVWVVILAIYWQWEDMVSGWKHFAASWQRALAVLSAIVWLPLLGIALLRQGSFRLWLGLPAHVPSLVQLGKQFVGVFVHLFLRGPLYPDTWLAKAPVLDVFTLVMCLLGIYFYVTHLGAFRTRLLASFGLLGVILVALGGSVGLSLLVPLLYVSAAAGMAYLLHEWLSVFPLNPLARGLGLGLIFMAVGLASIYNLRAYYIAWPHNELTQASFQYHR